MLRGLPSAGAFEPVLHGMIVTSHNLSAELSRQMHYKRRFEIEHERTVRLTHNHEHLRFGRILQAQGSNFSLCYTHLILRYEAPRAHNAKRDFRAIHALQPG